MQSLIHFFLHRSIFVNLLTALLILWGGLQAFHSRREAFPNIDFDIVTVVTLYPGASPGEVESLVTNPLEDGIQEVDGIKEYRSSSLEGRSGIVITIDPDITDTSQVVDDIRSAVERTEGLPDVIEKPVVTEITSSRTPVIEYALYADPDADTDYADLRNQAQRLENLLLNVPGVARIERKGWRDAEIHVDLNPNALDANYATSGQVIRALRERNVNLPGGDLDNGERELIVRTVGEFDTARQIESTPIRSNDTGQYLPIGRVASVQEGFEDPLYLESTRGIRSISLVVIKRESADIIDLVDETRGVVREFMQTVPESIHMAEVNDISYFVKRRLRVLVSNGLQGLVLVVVSLFFFMGWRTSFMVALGIPVALGSAFIVMGFMGVTINLISMFGMIMVIGILVDDAIVVSENFYRYLESGHTVGEAAIKGTAEVIAPVLATVTTTIAAFAPMLFMSGIFGKFISVIPLVVIICLVASLLECFFILPSHLYDMNRFGSGQQEQMKSESNWFFRFRKNVYEPALAYSLQRRGWILLGFVGLLITSVFLQIAFGNFKLFPGAIETLQVRVTAPTDLNKETTERFLRAIEHEIEKLPSSELDTYVSRAGITQKDANDPFTRRGSNYGDIKIYLTPELDRERSAEEIALQLRMATAYLLDDAVQAQITKRNQEEWQYFYGDDPDHSPLPESAENPNSIPSEYSGLSGRLKTLEFEKLAGGPPVGKPVAIEITGSDFTRLLDIGKAYQALLNELEFVHDIDSDYVEGKQEVRVHVNEKVAAQAGISVAQVAEAVNTALAGTVATSIKRPEEEVDIVVRYGPEFRTDLAILNSIKIANLTQNLIPANRLIELRNGRGPASINHKNGRRLLTVSASIDERETSAAAIATAIHARDSQIRQDNLDYT
ncbi:MAG: efflux RND transporter permease subunit, partial [Leptospiraceae bacterium]|nr:efflux RND transporter permease subunit [Leptospiraceae bacterium]